MRFLVECDELVRKGVPFIRTVFIPTVLECFLTTVFSLVHYFSNDLIFVLFKAVIFN
jgi:hypothetical protein